MGLTFCKSLFTRNKTQSSVNVENGTVNNGAQQATANGFGLSTLQSAVESQESLQSSKKSARPTIAMSSEILPSKKEEDEFIEKVACNESDIQENEMKEIDMGDEKKVLLIKQNGKLSAIGSKCAHYGAPLIMGALGEGRVRCPWHGACFNIETGDIEDFPGLGSIPCFEVRVESGEVKIRAKKSELENDKRSKAVMMNDVRSDKVFVVIGGGPSAQTCVETLREKGFNGRIVMVCKEAFLPYDRVKVDKQMNIKLEEIQLRDQKFYQENQIEVLLGVGALSLDTQLKEISLTNDKQLKYDKLFVATGSRAKKPDIPGCKLENIFTLRNIDDAHKIDSSMKSSSHVIILGSSYIALEAAVYCVSKATKVTIVGRGSVPLLDSFGELIGERIMRWFKSKNIEFVMNSGIKSFVAINQEEKLSAVKLLNGSILKADVCIVAIGSELNTELLQSSGLALNPNGSIDTNLFLETKASDVFVGGDIANSPLFINNNELATISHYAVAQYHGSVAALNMLGLKTELRTVPYFFTYLFETCFTYCKASEILIEGDLESLKFTAFYFDGNENLIAMSSCQPDKKIAVFAEKLTEGQRFNKKNVWQLLGEKTVEPTELVLPSHEDFIEKVACNESDIQENEMKEIDMGDEKKVLLIKQNGKLSAIGSKCAHYGAPLIMGALGEGRVRCPWHGACFNIETGDIEDFPGLDSIPCFEVRVESGKVKIRAKKSELENDKRVKVMNLREPRSGDLFVIVGGGPSSQTCVETLRQNGFKGRIIMVCKESFLPYDRIKVSKFLNSKIEDIQLRQQSFYEENQIEVLLSVEATSLDTQVKELSLSSGNKLKYDKLFIATGSRAKKLSIPGNELENIFTLRNFDDAKKIDSAINSASHVVILGSSFIGMEAAAYCAEKVAKVTVVGRSSVPLIETFGEAIGNRIMQLFKSKNVEFIMNSNIKSFKGNNNKLESVELMNGIVLPLDVCIVGIGSELNTDFLAKSGLSINVNGSIDSDIFLETNIADVFVGGDIANSPLFTNNNEPTSIGHYALAQYHGKVAALNMLGSRTELKAVPYFFTNLFDHCFTYTGHGNASEIFVEGDLESLKFVAFYFDEEEKVLGMSSCQPDRSIAEFAEKLAQGYRFHKSDIEWINENEQ